MNNVVIKTEKQDIKEEVLDEVIKKAFKRLLFGEKENEIKVIKKEAGEKPNQNLKKDVFTCDVCKKRFNRKFNLEVHMRVHTGEKPFVCEVCDNNFATNSTLKTHMVTHCKEKQFNCDICGKSYTLKNTLKYHLKLHSMQFTCEMCKENFSSQNELAKHLRIHLKLMNLNRSVVVPGKLTQKNQCVCLICNKKYSQKSFDAHMRIHTREKPYKCSMCDKNFTTKQNLESHTKIFHSKKNPLNFPCLVCGSTYNVKTNLKIHMRMHTGENLYKCDVCSYASPMKSVFETHKRTHTGEKPYQCNECGFKLVSKQHLGRHITCSFNAQFNVCKICDLKFRYKCAYKMHNKIHHP